MQALLAFIKLKKRFEIDNDEIISTAPISNTPGSYNGYKVDDVVWVAFEDGSMDSPVVIGKLYLGDNEIRFIQK